jgi:Recombinase
VRRRLAPGRLPLISDKKGPASLGPRAYPFYLPLRASRRPSSVKAALSSSGLPADSRAAALASTIRKLLAAGFVSRRALADELNGRGIPTARGGTWRYTTVVRILTRLGLLTSGKGAKINNGLASKQAADARAKALASTIRALRGKHLVSLTAIARELNAREIPTAFGGKWHPTSVSRLLHRLERLEPSSRTVVAADERR